MLQRRVVLHTYYIETDEKKDMPSGIMPEVA